MKAQTVPSRLKDRAVLSAKPQPSRYKISDDYGLYLLVMPKGGKHWRFDYRFAGARRAFSIGPYPLFRLAEARDERDKARKLLRDGLEPGERRKQERAVEELTAAAAFSVIAGPVRNSEPLEALAHAAISRRSCLDGNRVKPRKPSGPSRRGLIASAAAAPLLAAAGAPLKARDKNQTPLII